MNCLLLLTAILTIIIHMLAKAISSLGLPDTGNNLIHFFCVSFLKWLRSVMYWENAGGERAYDPKARLFAPLCCVSTRKWMSWLELFPWGLPTLNHRNSQESQERAQQTTFNLLQQAEENHLIVSNNWEEWSVLFAVKTVYIQ